MLKKLMLSVLILFSGVVSADAPSSQSIKTNATDFMKGLAWGLTHGFVNRRAEKYVREENGNQRVGPIFHTLTLGASLSSKLSIKCDKDGSKIITTLNATPSRLIGHAVGQTIAEGLVFENNNLNGFKFRFNIHQLLGAARLIYSLMGEPVLKSKYVRILPGAQEETQK